MEISILFIFLAGEKKSLPSADAVMEESCKCAYNEEMTVNSSRIVKFASACSIPFFPSSSIPFSIRIVSHFGVYRMVFIFITSRARANDLG